MLMDITCSYSYYCQSEKKMNYCIDDRKNVKCNDVSFVPKQGGFVALHV